MMLLPSDSSDLIVARTKSLCFDSRPKSVIRRLALALSMRCMSSSTNRIGRGLSLPLSKLRNASTIIALSDAMDEAPVGCAEFFGRESDTSALSKTFRGGAVPSTRRDSHILCHRAWTTLDKDGD